MIIAPEPEKVPMLSKSPDYGRWAGGGSIVQRKKLPRPPRIAP
jgi:hypothetical protein